MNARVAEHQLNDSDVHAIDQQPTGAFVTQIVPAEVDSPYVLLVPCCSFLS